MIVFFVLFMGTGLFWLWETAYLIHIIPLYETSHHGLEGNPAQTNVSALCLWGELGSDQVLLPSIDRKLCFEMRSSWDASGWQIIKMHQSDHYSL